MHACIYCVVYRASRSDRGSDPEVTRHVMEPGGEPIVPDELDALMRHLVDGDWTHVAWRAMANLQKRIEERECANKGSGG